MGGSGSRSGLDPGTKGSGTFPDDARAPPAEFREQQTPSDSRGLALVQLPSAISRPEQILPGPHAAAQGTVPRVCVCVLLASEQSRSSIAAAISRLDMACLNYSCKCCRLLGYVLQMRYRKVAR